MNAVSPVEMYYVLIEVASEVRSQSPKELLIVRRRITELLLRQVEENFWLLRGHDVKSYSYLFNYQATYFFINKYLYSPPIRKYKSIRDAIVFVRLQQTLALRRLINHDFDNKTRFIFPTLQPRPDNNTTTNNLKDQSRLLHAMAYT